MKFNLVTGFALKYYEDSILLHISFYKPPGAYTTQGMLVKGGL
jgi:hypothetical protein